MSVHSTTTSGVKIDAPHHPGQDQVLTPEAIHFLAELQRRFNGRRLELLAARKERQKRLDAGEKPDFLPETKHIRESEWTVAPIPADLQDRRIEITGPTDRKMIINALNSGSSVFMADFEDANTPTWGNLIEGQINLTEAIARKITFSDPASGKQYKLNEKTAVLFVRPRGWHLDEEHIVIDGKPMSFPQCEGAAGGRHRTILLPAEDGEPSRSPALERRFHLCAAGPRHSSRQHPCDRPD
jgi:malate synthase